MFQSFYNGLSGMKTSSEALDIVSDNVANMQTPGFKSKEVFFSNVESGDKGLGARVASESVKYTDGEVSQTGNVTDLYLDGRAMFVLRDGTNQYYTRAGTFTLNDDNVLVDRLSGYEVAGIDNRGAITDIKIGDKAAIAAVASTEATLTGEISTKDPNVSLEGMGYFDSEGEYKELSTFLEYNADDETWGVSITDIDGNEVGQGTLEFDLAGTLTVGSNEVVATLEGGQLITVSFGEPGSLTGLTLREENETSTLELTEIDGSAESPYTELRFEDDGNVVLIYGNGDEASIGRVAVAKVDNFDDFSVKDGHLLVAEKKPEITAIGRGVDASIISGSLELSNVDLAEEFGDMMVIQRTYQASSRVMTVSNQLLEQLYNSTGG
ncbi:flagellar hook-basal body complex protein [Enterovibrio baiacu]|uniref:flagellar hook-basal body complex protein n=1 Tax=Enterovibrio baiacu TaxID=2491023 RepID=UPI001011B112|nr:flagellar hook-basal body complex protein [Enterovibrio baiacu]MBE1277711.1 flagellar hook protein FlgE [Enterovibrio baiacu]